MKAFWNFVWRITFWPGLLILLLVWLLTSVTWIKWMLIGVALVTGFGLVRKAFSNDKAEWSRFKTSSKNLLYVISIVLFIAIGDVCGRSGL